MKKRTLLPEHIAPRAGLATVQRLVAHAVMAPMGARQRLRHEHAPVASAFIKPNSQLSSLSRLEIYHQQYWWRLQSALIEDFPGLRAVLGARRFDRLMDDYLAAHGSTSWNLRDLGQHLEAFLRERPELSEPYAALALDMARVEWARVIAFDGAQHPAFDLGASAAECPGRLRIGLQSFVTLAAVSYPVDRMLGRLRQGKIRLRRPQPLPSTLHLAIHRQDFSVYYRRLAPGEFFLLASLRDGVPLETACADALKRSAVSMSEFELQVQRWFAHWAQLGWLCRLSLPVR